MIKLVKLISDQQKLGLRKAAHEYASPPPDNIAEVDPLDLLNIMPIINSPDQIGEASGSEFSYDGIDEEPAGSPRERVNVDFFSETLPVGASARSEKTHNKRSWKKKKRQKKKKKAIRVQHEDGNDQNLSDLLVPAQMPSDNGYSPDDEEETLPFIKQLLHNNPELKSNGE